jgi:hypothetical protein
MNIISVAPCLLAQVSSNWICESAIKINDVYYYYMCVLNLPSSHSGV